MIVKPPTRPTRTVARCRCGGAAGGGRWLAGWLPPSRICFAAAFVVHSAVATEEPGCGFCAQAESGHAKRKLGRANNKKKERFVVVVKVETTLPCRLPISSLTPPAKKIVHAPLQATHRSGEDVLQTVSVSMCQFTECCPPTHG
eukprot:GHVU01119522.1.p1 GENE.GHVU01119522.1~~GHVU01119522.1.p1  ORF type:complete len:144 (-),score=10.52 GHVU01119522.1:375-806(-)